MVNIIDIEQKKTAISVTGLGYVGLPLAIAFAKHVDVIGFDLNKKKIESYKNNIDLTNEVGQEALKQSTIKFTSNEADLLNAMFHIVAVPTPVLKNKTPDLSYLESACILLGKNLRKGSVVVFESTVYPGVTEDYCTPILEEYSGLKNGTDFKVGYSPERINPGDKNIKLEEIIKIVSGQDEETLELVTKVYSMIITAGVYKAPTIKVAEGAKVIENSQRDINIAFVNELAMIFDRMDISTLEVLKAANTKWNFLDFRPGLVGGHCISVDPYYLTYCASMHDYNSEVILAGRRINDNMGIYIANKTLKLLSKANISLNNPKIAILGITFKENCPDIRNSRVISIIEELQEFGIEPIVVDPIANKEETKQEYGIVLDDINKLKDIDALIIAVAHDQFVNNDYSHVLKKGGVLMDIKGITKAIEGGMYWCL